MIIRVIILLFLCVPFSAAAQREAPRRDPRPKFPSWLPKPPDRKADRPARLPLRKRYKPVGYSNVLTAHLPAIMIIQKHAPAAVGPGYERFLSHRGMLSVNISAYEYRTFFYYKSDGPSLIVSGFQGITTLMYHPFGNRRLYDLSAGIGMAFGHHRRTQDTGSYPGPEKLSIEGGPLSAVLGKLAFTLHSPGRFVFGIHFSAGRLLQPANRERLMLLGGLTIGSRF